MDDFRLADSFVSIFDNNNCIRYYNCQEDETYEASWCIISQKVLQILKKDTKQKLLFEPIYSRIYKNVCEGNAQRMYYDLLRLCAEHISEIQRQLCPPDDLSLEHLVIVGEYTREYLQSIKTITSVFSYLNKFYMVYHHNVSIFSELAGLYNRMILSQRIPILMYIAEETLKVPCSFPPSILHRFFNDVNDVTEGEYSLKYVHLFSKYCVNVLPPMRECDLEGHIAEVRQFQERQRIQHVPQPNQGLKRPAEEDDYRR